MTHDEIELTRSVFLLATGQLDERAAQDIIHRCQPIVGWYPLETLDLVSVLADAEDRWGEHPELERLAEQACHRVWNKWSSTGDVAGAASEWALDLIAECAAEEGITLPEDGGDYAVYCDTKAEAGEEPLSIEDWRASLED